MSDLGVFSKKTEVRCPGCGYFLFGYEVEIANTKVMLTPDGFIRTRIKGPTECPTCRTKFHRGFNVGEFIKRAQSELNDNSKSLDPYYKDLTEQLLNMFLDLQDWKNWKVSNEHE